MTKSSSGKKILNVALLGQGNAPHIHRIAESLVDRGHKVSIIASESSPVPPLKNVSVYTFSSNAPTSLKLKQLKNIIRTIGPDILHSHFINYGGLLGVASGFHPHISSAWGCDVLNVPNISLLNHMKVTMTLRAIDGVLPVSKQLQTRVDELVQGHHYNKIFHWGIDTDLFSNSEVNQKKIPQFRGKLKKQTGPIVLSPRAVQPIYRHHVLIDAWPHVLKKYPDAQLVFCPYHIDSDYGPQLKQQIRDLGIEDSVTWLDGLTQKDLVGAYLGSDVIVSIPRTDGTLYTILEAMACERPIVASHVESVKSWLTSDTNSIFVDGESASSVASGLTKMFEQLNKDNSAARKIILDKVDRSKCMDQLENIYLEVIGNVKNNNFNWFKTIKNISQSFFTK